MRLFLPFLLFLFVIAAIIRAEVYFSIAYLFFLVYWASRMWMQRVARGLALERRFTPRAFYGDEVEVEVKAHNRSRLPIPWMELHESLPVELIAPPFRTAVVNLGAHGRHRFRYTLMCRKRGYYPIGPLTARTGDVLGLHEPRQLGLAAEVLIVYPRIAPLEKLGLPTRSPLVELPARAPLFEDPARVSGVRDYVPGDSLRRIHWSATANEGRLLVKRFQPAIARETMICLDLNEASYSVRQRFDASELAIVAAASLANHIAVRERLPVGLATEAFDPLTNARARFVLPPRRGRGSLTGVLDVLARAQLIAATPLPELLRRESVNLAWGATLVVITSHADAALFDTFLHLRRAGFALVLLLVRPEAESLAAQRRMALPGMPVYHLWAEREMEAWR
jgi:uncharacterized protein (DUF58 family)